MDISVFWHEPITMKDGSSDNMTYTIEGIDRFDEVSGVYMFCRKYKNKLIPLYIGKALNIDSRIKQQLNANRLMNAIENASAGERMLVIGEFRGKPGQQREKCIRMVEKALIGHALAEGYVLINLLGTKTPHHKMSFTGNSLMKEFTGSTMYIKRRGNT